MACDTPREEETFVSFVGGDEWPYEMETSRQNLLPTQRNDEDVADNRSYARDFLVSLLACYRHLLLQLEPLKEAKYSANFIETTN